MSDEKWAFVAPYLTLMTEDAPRRDYPLREIFNGLRWLVRAGAPWRLMPNDLPPWHAVYQQTRRWLAAGVFETMVGDPRELPRVAQGRAPEPTAAILDSRTMQSTPESGARAGYDGYKRRKGSKVHVAVDTLSHLLDQVEIIFSKVQRDVLTPNHFTSLVQLQDDLTSYFRQMDLHEGENAREI